LTHIVYVGATNFELQQNGVYKYLQEFRGWFTAARMAKDDPAETQAVKNADSYAWYA